MLRYPLPFCRFVLSSGLPPEELESRLFARIASNPSIGERASFGIEAMFWKLEGKQVPLWLEGKVTGGRFQIHRFISGRNSFIPVLEGTIERGSAGSVMNILARPDWLVLALVIAWMILVASISFSVYAYGGLLFPFLLALAGPVIATASFVPQLVSIRRDLASFINPEPAGVHAT